MTTATTTTTADAEDQSSPPAVVLTTSAVGLGKMMVSSDISNAANANMNMNINDKGNGNDGDDDDDDSSSRSGTWSNGYDNASRRSGLWSHRFDDDDDADQSTSNSTAFSPTTNTQGSIGPGSTPNISDESVQIAKKENRAVMTSRVVMFGVLIVTTIVVAFLVFYSMSGQEKAEFETAFAVNSLKIFESLGSSMDSKLEAVDSLAMLFVSSAREKNESFPYTVLPDFASKAAKVRISSHAIALQQYQYVEEDQRSEWEVFAKENEGWVQEVIDVERKDSTFGAPAPIPDYDNNHSTSIRYDGPVANNTGPYTPSWQTYPMLPTGKFSAYNFNAIQHKMLGPGIGKVIADHRVIIGPVLNFEDSKEAGGENRVTIWAARHVAEDVDASEPVIRILYPILNTSEGAITVDEPDSKVVGIIASSFFWKSFLEHILPNGEDGLCVVFKNTFNQIFTYEINGHGANWVGPGDLHDPQFDYMGRSLTFKEIGLYSAILGKHGGLPIDEEYCTYTVSTYPSQTMKDDYYTADPIIFTIIAVAIFAFTALVFIAYDKLVARRQRKVMKTAIQNTAIVSSLFPSIIRDRLMEDNDVNEVHQNLLFKPNKSRLRTYLNDGEPNFEHSSKPIADLFTDTTVLFADIAGFTAWSSVREPTQVFTLLENVYSAFDTIATRRGVFKVETIGDSYVAVTGLPNPREDHAVVMVKFARDCRQQFNELCSILESSLGPETGDLQLRIGLHSGPVTAGVLRGQKSRFQLFGDTVNTAARMESTGKVSKIQVSQATANLLKKAKKIHWLQPREEMVEAKGKGLLLTFWVEPKQATSSSTLIDTMTSRVDLLSSPRINSSQTERLINWNIDVLEKLLKKIIARRIALERNPTGVNWNRSHDAIVLNEVKEVIKLPEYDSKFNDAENPDLIVLEPPVLFQLREFVTTIALTYHDNPFHNFPHASHVCMSVAKLLSRIIAPDQDFEKHEQLHDHTYGITSDPLTQFACVFSALIHDADHPGVPNAQLLKEETEIAKTYEGKSIAEQNSINLAWKILIQPKYLDLRKAICVTQLEEVRFRQLVVNAVCATDIVDKDLKQARNQRWEKAFSTSSSLVNVHEQINRKATIVIEHIIQASDVAHTMQHWHVYIKWNERLYAEMYKAYTEGRAEKDPTESWYKGEIGFFDFYIIPLAQKLNECGVFGVSSDEYLDYAIMNRNEWEKKGRDVVAGYIEKYKKDTHRILTGAAA